MSAKLPALLMMVGALTAVSARADLATFGTEDCLGTGCYGASDPTAGATLQGLAPGAVTLATSAFGHGYPFSPSPGDFTGTDQIYVGSVQTAAHDGYSTASQRVNGPDVLTMNYSSLVGPGRSVSTLTLGIAADDFQFPALGQPFTVTVNGVTDVALTAELNSLNETGPLVEFFTVGLNPSIDTSSHILTVSIDEGGDGGDGWAVDFATIGVTTRPSSSVPEPSSMLMLLMLEFTGAAVAAGWRLRNGLVRRQPQ